jgi:photosystem II stability/assembly factor-like uncharacterized protein
MANDHARTKIRAGFFSAILVFSLVVSVPGSNATGQAGAPGEAALSIESDWHEIQGFHLVSADEGWLFFDQRLYWTKTGGQSWEDITPSFPGQSVIRAVSFPDTQSGWLVLTESAEDGFMTYTIARTSNGGNSWQITPISLFEPGDVSSLAGAIYLHFLDFQTGWLVVQRATSSNFSVGTLFKTTDGGHTWTRLTLPIGEPVYFVTSEIGWTAGGASGEELYRTQDGGLTWSPQVIQSVSASINQRRLYQLPRFENEQEGVLPLVVVGGPETQIEFYTTQDGGQSWNLSTSVPVDQEIGGISELDMVTPSVGWARHMAGDCSRAPQTPRNSESPVETLVHCSLEVNLLRTDDGGQTWNVLNLPQALSSPSPDGSFMAVESSGESGDRTELIPSLGSRTQTFAGHGFDSCTLPSASQMQNWITHSPYRVWNLYMGGSSRGNCGTLTASFISQLAQQGWKFIPTWVGPQASCTTIFGATRMSSNPTVAYDQGISEANAAIARAASLGLTLADASGTMIYYDLEAYNPNDTACRNAASAFISGWSGQLRSRGNQAGVYGSPCGSALSDFASLSHVPDGIWPAHWIYTSYNRNATVWNLACLSNTLWTNSQRIRQYTGGHNETWGGVTLNIDSNVLDGIVATICPSIVNWKGEYWNNTNLSGPAQLCRDDSTLDFDWGLGPPAGTMPSDNFSARWTRTLSFPAGQYRFYMRHDDGARLYIDDVLRLNAWSTCCRWSEVEVTLSSGNHTIRMEMFESGGAAYAALRWERLDITGWRGEYYNNTSLSNYPILVRDDGADLNFNWLSQSPDPVIQNDQFSARWTRTISFAPGAYRFDVFHDDGARLYIDNTLVLENWCNNCNLTDSTAVRLSGGPHTLRLEMWDNSGWAAVRLSWQALDKSVYLPLIFRSP